jgi:ABC-2 type transport system permease protein
VIALVIARATIRRTARDRTGLFFMIVLPVLIIVVIGSTVRGGDRFPIGVVDQGSGELGAALVEDLESADSLDVRRFDDLETMKLAVRRSELAAGVVVPRGLDEQVRAGGSVAVGFLTQPSNTTGLAAREAVESIVADHSALLTAAGFAADEAGGTVADHLARAQAATAGVEPLTVDTTVSGESRFLPAGFTYSAASMLVLFVFINAVAGGGVIVENRRLGLYERMLAAPVTPRAIVAGETFTYVLIALLQSLLIVAVGGLLFEVDWGDPLAAMALVLTWSTVGASAGLLAGTVLRTAEQAGAIGPIVGIALGMLGGCMWPLEIVPPLMKTVGHLVPHGWAVDSWIELLSRDGTIGDIAGPLLVLGGFAAVLGTLAAFRLRRQLTA